MRVLIVLALWIGVSVPLALLVGRLFGAANPGLIGEIEAYLRRRPRRTGALHGVAGVLAGFAFVAALVLGSTAAVQRIPPTTVVAESASRSRPVTTTTTTAVPTTTTTVPATVREPGRMATPVPAADATVTWTSETEWVEVVPDDEVSPSATATTTTTAPAPTTTSTTAPPAGTTTTTAPKGAGGDTSAPSGPGGGDN